LATLGAMLLCATSAADWTPLEAAAWRDDRALRLAPPAMVFKRDASRCLLYQSFIVILGDPPLEQPCPKCAESFHVYRRTTKQSSAADCNVEGKPVFSGPETHEFRGLLGTHVFMNRMRAQYPVTSSCGVWSAVERA
jgi:hypothetical protein